MSSHANKKIKTSTWYRHVNTEVNDVLNSINFSGPSTIPNSNNNFGSVDDATDISNTDGCNFDSTSFFDFGSAYSDSSCEAQFLLVETGLPETSNSTSINVTNTVDSLRHWAVQNKIPHTALGQLLIILNESGATQFKRLPKDPRSFLNTPRSSNINTVEPGHYYHIGIKNAIEIQYKRLNLKPSGRILVGINIDGLPLAKSTSSHFYPILCINKNISCLDNVTLVGVYHGYEKPHSFSDFLKDFVTEATDLTNNGIMLFGKIYPFEITMLLFDAVAKASILSIKGHAGYSSCTKCTQEGEFIQNRICFPDIKYIKRTHESFVQKRDPNHHTGDTILTQIPNINLIEDIPLDYMHLVCLGVVKKMLCGIWCYGSPPHKLSFRVIQSISQNLELLSKYMPSEFARKPRGLKEVKRWKATEFRQFLFYSGPIVLKKRLTNRKYEHFLILFVSLTLLVSQKFCSNTEYLNYAESLLEYFVKTTKSLYGPQFLTHNFHNLLHLCDDVKKFGCLENFSNFSSENYLQKLLKMIRKPDNPLAQIIRRIHELNTNLLTQTSQDLTEVKLDHEYTGGILTDGCTGPESKTLTFKDFKLNLSYNNSCCLLKNGCTIEIKNFAFDKLSNTNVVIGHSYTSTKDFFKVPCESSILGVFFVENLGPLSHWPILEIDTKLVRLPYEEGFVVFPLLHLN